MRSERPRLVRGAGIAESRDEAFPVRLCHLSLNSAPQVHVLATLSFLHLPLSHRELGLIFLSLVALKFF